MVRALFVTLFLLPGAVFADPRMGRLPDGRAFRVDGEGYQLVDHMAELEVTVNELNQQIDTLEAQLRSGRSEAPVCPPVSACADQSEPTDCSAEVIPLQDRITALSTELQRTKYAAPVSVPVQSCNYEARLQPLREEIALLRQQLTTAPSKNVLQAVEQRELQLQNSLRSTQELLEKRAQQIELAESSKEETQEKLAQVRSELESTKLALEESQRRNLDLSSSQEKLASAQSELNRLKSEFQREREIQTAALKELELKARGNIVAKERVEAPQVAVTERAPESAARAMLSSGETPVQLGAVKSEFQSRLKEIQGLVLKRKDLSDSARGKKSGVAISLQPLQSSRGQSLDSIRSLIAAMQSDRDVRTIRLALSEIKQILLDDIQTFERLRKI